MMLFYVLHSGNLGQQTQCAQHSRASPSAFLDFSTGISAVLWVSPKCSCSNQCTIHLTGVCHWRPTPPLPEVVTQGLTLPFLESWFYLVSSPYVLHTGLPKHLQWFSAFDIHVLNTMNANEKRELTENYLQAIRISPEELSFIHP